MMGLPRNARGGSKVTGLGGYGKAPPRRKKALDGRAYKDAQPWHSSSPRVRVRQAILVSYAFLTGLHALGGHIKGMNWLAINRQPYCVVCNPEWS